MVVSVALGLVAVFCSGLGVGIHSEMLQKRVLFQFYLSFSKKKKCCIFCAVFVFVLIFFSFGLLDVLQSWRKRDYMMLVLVFNMTGLYLDNSRYSLSHLPSFQFFMYL